MGSAVCQVILLSPSPPKPPKKAAFLSASLFSDENQKMSEKCHLGTLLIEIRKQVKNIRFSPTNPKVKTMFFTATFLISIAACSQTTKRGQPATLLSFSPTHLTFFESSKPHHVTLSSDHIKYPVSSLHHIQLYNLLCIVLICGMYAVQSCPPGRHLLVSVW